MTTSIDTWQRLSWIYDALKALKLTGLGGPWIDEVQYALQCASKQQDGASFQRFFKWVVENPNPDRREFLLHSVLHPACEEVGGVWQPRYVVNILLPVGGPFVLKSLEFLAWNAQDAMDRVLSAYLDQDGQCPWMVRALGEVRESFAMLSLDNQVAPVDDITARFKQFAGTLLQ